MWSAAYSEQFISLQELHSQDLLLPRILAGLQQLGPQPGKYYILFANFHSLWEHNIFLFSKVGPSTT